ncbi:hypothetical protein QBC33DRAFT_520331 [Phialemonium atrogriseum]|uniref:Nephrocystin 3-like N-terminal domain-containing protein n=1 Tax=Phialemonium atrogriseum TaxID=1093897 RepID=A0AAJ0C8W8_9PEZI|nr:uncharacterized protein QBC33DRAFT_520331 [Phialemonium atrogriseum]KAK1772120.1 hypothetical protein QBC33DRAFT_520331 [Phialemonium atrogriseum]
MDPVTAFSLAVNILTVLDVAIKSGKTVKELYDSTNGFTKETQALEDATRDLNKTVEVLDDAKVRLDAAAKTADEQVSLIGGKCGIVSNQIQAFLNVCKVTKQKSTSAAIKGFLKGRKHQGELARLEKELKERAGQLETAIAVATRINVQRIQDQLERADKRQAELFDQLQEISKTILSQGSNPVLLQNLETLVQVSSEARAAAIQDWILRGLQRTAVNPRLNSISDAEETTFEWFLDPADEEQEGSGGTSDSEDLGIEKSYLKRRVKQNREIAAMFQDWLESGSRVFHLVGKPGSGKSTLMKFVTDHPKTHMLLEKWAVSMKKDLLVARFFLYKLGNDDEKTLRGLWHGLLYDICCGRTDFRNDSRKKKSSSDITRMLFPGLWKEGEHMHLEDVASLRGGREANVPDAAIKTAFDRLVNLPEISERFCICLFIDGLDEFDDKAISHAKLGRTLSSWVDLASCRGEGVGASGGSSIKLCVSSREYESIKQGLPPKARRLIMQEVTELDIRTLVLKGLGENRNFRTLQQQHKKRCQNLIQSIIRHSQGVILWVVLVLKLLDDELSEDPTIQSLERIVRESPAGLDGLFQSIVDSIPKHHLFPSRLILAMATKMLGWRLSTGLLYTDVPLSAGLLGTDVPLSTLSPIFRWDPPTSGYLSIGGLSKIMHILDQWGEENFDPQRRLHNFVLSNSQIRKGVEVGSSSRLDRTCSCVRAWTRGLLDVKTIQQFKNSQIFQVVEFMHRSIPEFLLRHIRTWTSGPPLNDDTVAEAILTTMLGEVELQLYRTVDFKARLDISLARMKQDIDSFGLTSPIFCILQEVDKKAILGSKPSKYPDWRKAITSLMSNEQQVAYEFTALDGSYYSLDLSSVTAAGSASSSPFMAWKLANDPAFSGDKAAQYAALWAITNGIYRTRTWTSGRTTATAFSESSAKTLRALFMANTLFDIALRPGTYDFLSLVTSNRLMESTLEIMRHYDDDGAFIECNRAQHMHLSPWIACVISYLYKTLVDRSHNGAYGGHQPADFWSMLEVWLEFGAQSPYGIRSRYYGRAWEVTFAILSNRTGKPLFLGFRMVFHGMFQEQVGEDVKEMKEGKRFILPIWEPNCTASLDDVIRYWKPENEKRLLEYSERNRRRAEKLRYGDTVDSGAAA